MEAEIAYLAGFIDGEGCISIGKSNGWYHVMLYANQINPEPLFLLHKRFGGSLKKSPRKGYRTQTMWGVSAREALEALTQLRPYLIVKAEEADLAMELQTRIATPQEKTVAARDLEVAERERIYLACKALKRRDFSHIELPRAAFRGPKTRERRVRLTAGKGTGTALLSRRGPRDPDRLAKMREMRASGLTLEAIAREFGTTKGNVWQMLNRYRRKPLPQEAPGG